MSPFVTATLIALAVVALSSGSTIAQTPPGAGSAPEAAGKPATQQSPAAAPALPKQLKGSITFRSPISQREAANTLDVEISSQDAGKFTGTFTRWVLFAGAEQCLDLRKVPVQGTYDGKVLVMNVRASAKTASCPDFTWELGPGKSHLFERSSADGWERIYFDPA